MSIQQFVVHLEAMELVANPQSDPVLTRANVAHALLTVPVSSVEMDVMVRHPDRVDPEYDQCRWHRALLSVIGDATFPLDTLRGAHE